jgi:hypothetical protein
MSQAFVDQVTLDCLLNKSLFNNQVKNKKAQSVNKEERKFYKKRIYNLFKEILINKAEPENLFPDVKYAYDNFINASINYFKTIDSTDLLQEEYKTLDETALENINAIPELGDDIAVEEADKLMMRSIKIKTPSLDKYVKRKTTKPQEKLILPKQKEVNLMDPELKVKGLNSNNSSNSSSNNNINIKKKNITNKYDELINTKKENKETIDKNEIQNK